jgi:hypothetical protein
MYQRDSLGSGLVRITNSLLYTVNQRAMFPNGFSLLLGSRSLHETTRQ